MESGRKKLKNYKKLDKKVFREKMGRFLASKGFEWEVVKEAVDRLTQEE